VSAASQCRNRKKETVMASIQNLRLQIVENEGAAAALVTFRVNGSPQDVQQQRTYAEIVELIGVDKIDGEDGQDEPIPFGRSEGTVTFTAPTHPRTRLLALPAAALNEDKIPSGPLSSAGADLLPDEIRARVMLAVSAESEIVVLHKQLVQPVDALPIPV
jgi:hypothetical protein